MTNPAEVFVGIDDSKTQLEIAVHDQTTPWQPPNTDTGIGELGKRMQAMTPTRIVLEATGGFALRLVAELVAAKLPVVITNPRGYVRLPVRQASWPKLTNSKPRC